jgi:hypothetical protein
VHVQIEYPALTRPGFVVDTFPEEQGSPVTDHADFINLMPDQLMARLVTCLNQGNQC